MTKHSIAVSLLLAILLAPLAGCETQPRYGEVRVRDRHYDVRVVFSERDIAVIRDYYAPRRGHGHPHGYPPGLAKKDKVPPGHAKKFRRGEPLPRELAWRAMPRELEERLSRLPDGYVRIVVGADIGIMNVRTRVVMDLLEDISD